MPSHSGPDGAEPDRPEETNDEPRSLRSDLHAALREALASRDRRLVKVLRTTVAELSNAEAVSSATSVSPLDSDADFAGSVPGLRAAEVPRRELQEEEVLAIVRRAAAERLDAASDFEGGGETARAEELRWEAEQLRQLVDRSSPPRHDE